MLGLTNEYLNAQPVRKPMNRLNRVIHLLDIRMHTPWPMKVTNWQKVMDIDLAMRKAKVVLRNAMSWEDYKNLTINYSRSELEYFGHTLQINFCVHGLHEEYGFKTITNSGSFSMYIDRDRNGVVVDFDELIWSDDDYTNLDNVVFISNDEFVGNSSRVNPLSVGKLIAKIIQSKL